MKVLITGFMGSGKTYFLNKLKGFKLEEATLFIDLDEEVFNNFKEEGDKNLSDLINRRGLKDFRELEYKCLKKLLNLKENLFISLGGGSLDEEKTCSLVLDKGLLIYLKEEFDICWGRIEKDIKRPLAQKGREFCKNLYAKRVNTYERADITLKSQDISLLTHGEFRKLLADKL